MPFVTLHYGRACLTVCSIGCGVRIGVYFALKTGCRLICKPSTAARSALCQLPSSTLASAFLGCGMRTLGTQRLNVLVPRMGTFETARSVRPASQVGLASLSRSVDGRTAGAFRALTTLSGWCMPICKALSMWSQVTVSTTARPFRCGVK
jgi:hypothetical protein